MLSFSRVGLLFRGRDKLPVSLNLWPLGSVTISFHFGSSEKSGQPLDRFVSFGSTVELFPDPLTQTNNETTNNTTNHSKQQTQLCPAPSREAVAARLPWLRPCCRHAALRGRVAQGYWALRVPTHGVAWFGVVSWCGMTWHDMAWHYIA